MKLNIVEIAKEVFKDKEELTIEELPNDKVKIWYRNKRMYRKIGGTDPRPFILPKFIELNEEFAEAIGLYLGDGKNTKNDHRHLDFASKDSDILHFMMEFFTKCLLVRLCSMTISIKYKFGRKGKILDKWSKMLSVPKEKFKISFQNRNRYDTVSIQINSAVLNRMFIKIIDMALGTIGHNQSLRRGFLRGYFAAEGTIGYNSSENYLNYVGFSYNPKTEDWLRDYCMSCLRKENIRAIIKERGSKGDIIISGWQNYYKLWLIKLFDICQRKRKIFFNILLSRDIYCDLDEKFRESFFSSLTMSQRQIANIISSYQGNVSRTIGGYHLLRINQIKKLLQYTNLSFEEFIKNIKAVRVGNGKEHISDRIFIKNAFDMQNINQETRDS